MANLILGPQLRRVTRDQAVIWVQTDAPVSVTVRAGDEIVTVDTFETHGVHVAVPVITPPKMTTAYTIELGGEPVWPLPDTPPSVITVRDEDSADDATIVFGSCREDADHPDPDALVAYARRAMSGEQPLPDLLALIGDQIYADKVWTFAEYAALYEKAWSEPHVRWLLSTVSTVMIFDDHEIHDDWNSSAAWLAEMSARPGWDDHLRAGLESYWLFQHLGNDPTAAKLPDDWSFTVDIGRTRLIMLDCRGSRQLDGGERRMFPQAQWDRLRERTRADCDHLVLAASLPWLLAPAVHYGESAMEVLSHRYPKMEMLRRKYDLEHWSAVGHSFDELTEVVEAVHGPATVSVIGGDVHHSYIAQVRPGLHQITCSPLNNSVGAKMRLLLKIGWWRALSGPAALLARLVGVPRDHIRWKLLTKPYFGNAIATLTHRGRTAHVLLEGTRADGTLYPVASADLT